MRDLIVHFCWIESEISLKQKQKKQKNNQVKQKTVFKRRIIVSVYLHLHLGRL